MASIREIKLRIKSIKETRQITKAMKLISAAKLKRARQQLEQTRPYFDKVQETMKDILVHSGHLESVYFKKGEPRIQDPQKVYNAHEAAGTAKAFIVITADKGLAGGYNHNVIKLVEKQLKENPGSALFVIGHMGRNFFMKKNYNIDLEFDFVSQNPTLYRARDIAEVVMRIYSESYIDEISLIYTHMVSSLKLEPRILKLLPLDISEFTGDAGEVRVDDTYIYEPSPRAVLDVLVPKYLKGILYGALVEAFTSEQSARMSAMDNATSSADDMLQRLNLFYNRARQASITQEISEIVGGAAALE